MERDFIARCMIPCRERGLTSRLHFGHFGHFGVLYGTEGENQGEWGAEAVQIEEARVQSSEWTPARLASRFRHPVLDHFYNPRNAGIAANFTHSFLEQNNPWHVRLLFTLRVSRGRIEEVRFKAQSCVTTTACASKLTEMVQGRGVAEALSLTPEQLSEALGVLPQEKIYCVHLVINTLRAAIQTPQAFKPGRRSQREGRP